MSRIEIPAFVCARIYGTVDKRAVAVRRQIAEPQQSAHMRSVELEPPGDLRAIVVFPLAQMLHPRLRAGDREDQLCRYQETVLYERGDTIKAVYFPHEGVISLVVDLASADMIESAMVGRDSVAGGSAAFDNQISLNRAVVQIAGRASALDVDQFRWPAWLRFRAERSVR
jgi:hypothetical protein